MNSVDVGIAVVLAFCFWKGWSKGIARSLMGPVSLVICFFYGYAYYARTHNYLISLVIWIAGPVIVTSLFSFSLWMFNRFKVVVDQESENRLGGMSRLLGGVFSDLWIMAIAGVAFVLIAFVPMELSVLGKVRGTILDSRTFGLFADTFGDWIPVLKSPRTMEGLLSTDQARLKNLEHTQEYQDVVTDPRLQFLMSDADIREKIDNKDFMALLNDERIQQIMQNPELVQKFLKLNQKMILQGRASGPGEGEIHADDLYENH